MGFTKLDSGIIHSSIWSEPLSTRILWITILAMSDENGFVSASLSGLLRASNISEEEFNLAILTLESPDLESRTPDFEGRRIEKVEGGWIILNFLKYRAKSEVIKEQTRERVRRFRQKKEDVTQCNVTETLLSASASASASASDYTQEFLEYWEEYPRKTGKGAAFKSWKKIKAPVETLQKIKKALEWQKKSSQWTKDNGQFIPHPTTYLNQRRWEDEEPQYNYNPEIPYERPL